MRSAMLILVMTLVSVSSLAAASGPSFAELLTIAQGHLDSGEYDKALEILHELQVDHPDSGIVAYGIGKALYSRGQHQETLGLKDEAAASYGEAESAFSRLSAANDAQTALESAFGRLNAAARKAMLIPPDQKYDEAVSALRASVAGYQQFLREHPLHGGAMQNLDNIRLKLKQLLQNPQQQQQKQEDDKEQPPEDKKQPVVYFLSAGTEIPEAQAKAEGNQLELVVPGAEEAKP